MSEPSMSRPDSDQTNAAARTIVSDVLEGTGLGWSDERIVEHATVLLDARENVVAAAERTRLLARLGDDDVVEACLQSSRTDHGEAYDRLVIKQIFSRLYGLLAGSMPAKEPR